MSIETIPLNKLSVWKGNVRKTGAEIGLDELKASILVHGLLNPLTVQKTDKGDRRVIAGQRRLLALRALHKEGSIPADHPVQCTIVSSDSNATEISLAENVVRTQMHPADQFEAWRDLIDKGASVADVAARFGVSEAIVTKRLKLGRVSPKLLDLYRKGEMTLEQVQALTLTDDHAVQEAAWDGAESRWQRTADALRSVLTTGEVTATDKRVKFIGGLDTYEAAGGKVRRDLFDDRNAGYLSDMTLLNRLVVRKLEETADEVRSEGWKWIETLAEFDWDAVKGFGRVHEGHVALTPEQEAHLSELGEKYDELAAASEEEDLDDEQIAKVEQIEVEMQALQSTQKIYKSEDIARAGCFVSIGYQGEAEIRRGYVKPEDMAQAEAKGTASGATPAEETESDGLSAALIEDLTAQRTAALRVELAKSPLVALAATVHALGLSHFYMGSYRVASCVKVSTSVTPLNSLIKNPEQSKAFQAFNAESPWSAKVPEEAEDFWQWCVEQPMAMLLELLAYLVGRSVDVVTTKVSRPGVHADQLASALDLDMTKWFQPTAENYFSRVSKPIIIKALVEIDGGTPVAPVTEKLKKGALAEFAEKAVGHSGWLPEILRSEPAIETAEEDALDTAA